MNIINIVAVVVVVVVVVVLVSKANGTICGQQPWVQPTPFISLLQSLFIMWSHADNGINGQND